MSALRCCAKTLRVKALSGEEVRLDFGRGKHIVLFAGCTCIYVKRTAGQLAALAHSQGAKISFILVSEVHPDGLPREKSAEELAEYRASKVREFLGPDASVYFDIDQGAERSLEFVRIAVELDGHCRGKMIVPQDI